MSYLRNRETEGSASVTNIELFFDLVFVFAVTQLSHTLLAKLTPLGALQAGVLFLAVWWAWIYTSWVTNWLDPRHWPVRVGLLALMLAGLVLSTSLPTAFGAKGKAFAGAYVTMQVGRSLFMLWALGASTPHNTRNFQRMILWLSATGTLWILGSCFEPTPRLVLWLVALVFESTAPWLGFYVPGLGRSTTKDWDVDGAHLAERCSLFIIITLGEALLMTGATVSSIEPTLEHIESFLIAFVGSVAFWWIYFDTGAERGSQSISDAEDPGRLARLLYTYIHLLIVAGIIVSAVGDALLLANPQEAPAFGHIAATTGGAILFVIGNALFKGLPRAYAPWSHVVGLALLVTITVAPLVGAHLDLLAINALTNATLCFVAGWEAWFLRFRRTG